MVLDNESFNEVELDTFTSNPCSPREPDPTFLGILLNAPQKIWFNKKQIAKNGAPFIIIPVCGFFMLEMEYQMKFFDVKKAMRLVAVDTETGKEFTGKAIKVSTAYPDQKKPKLSPEQIKGKATGGYFNSNLAERVPIPSKEGKYDVHAELGERDSENFITSNIVTVEIIEEKE